MWGCVCDADIRKRTARTTKWQWGDWGCLFKPLHVWMNHLVIFATYYWISFLMWYQVHLRPVYTFRQPPSEAHGVYSQFESSVEKSSAELWSAQFNLWYDFCSVAINQQSCLILKTTHMYPLSKRYSALCSTYPDKMWLVTWLTLVMQRHKPNDEDTHIRWELQTHIFIIFTLLWTCFRFYLNVYAFIFVLFCLICCIYFCVTW